MTRLAGQHVLVIGRDRGGDAAVALLRSRGASVVHTTASTLTSALDPRPDFAVVSAPAAGHPQLSELAARDIPLLSERELAFRESLCLHVAVAGASGKTTTAQLIAHILRGAGRRVAIADGTEHPASSFAETSRDLDFLIHRIEDRELEYLHFFRPVVGVLLNGPADHPGSEGTWDDYLRRLARLFARQLPFDWAIVQSDTLAHLQALDAPPPSKVVTFSAFSRTAELGLDRSLLVSRWEGWTGPLWDMQRGHLHGPHFAEDALAALAVSRVLRLSLDDMTHALESFVPPAGAFETLGEAGGVRFIDDSRSQNLDALAKSLLALAPSPPENPAVWLIAGGDISGRQFYDLGPTLASRVRHAFVYGEAGPAMRTAWSLFTPCTPAASLLDAAQCAAMQAQPGDTILFSPACPASGNTASGPSAGSVFRAVFQARSAPAAAPEPRQNAFPAGGQAAAKH